MDEYDKEMLKHVKREIYFYQQLLELCKKELDRGELAYDCVISALEKAARYWNHKQFLDELVLIPPDDVKDVIEGLKKR